ncbi:siroheme synthase [Vibrio sp. V27_P1S3P104]|uniref:precorrin-2 dehydrogenase/sirohydrochlorin ferrochelatase family protein n=1 Tax=Vibrio TaxID=662 RepID=UPI000C1708FC|nr:MULTISPECIES: bifunctional precorrin-2 dehydrogenase/sirohydrochlorin ferrochelatase [Vibrio]NAW69341.1 siroheme synthase [Vibrio sp. V28_P6S34P95]NAX05164.1 siroheme synthase [Vibrio sp. V30_P3S12P165]NAX34081.1 siroheme synthase [Vibrio sp. V29_P1S30P107]NAX36552.1 siroheme synthase [Vibrio sp. V27_P1S3P104]NAX40518.1 siroheme synthase [Vibrio sp. V26_P1S5P106]
MRYFPLFLDLLNKAVLVVGGGEVACRKIETLLRAGAYVTVVSPQIASPIQVWVEQGRCQWVKNFYSSQFVTKDYRQVWATTDNPELNHQVYRDATAAGILVNVVDDQPYCDFITPSILERGRIQIAISSGGASPVLIRNVRETLEAVLPQNLALLADFGASKRNSIKEYLPTVDLRRKFWEHFFAQNAVKNATSRETLEKCYRAALTEEINERGEVVWIEYGADVELLPLKALRYMQQAELVLFEQACPYDYVDLCRRDAERESFNHPGQLSKRLVVAKQAQQSVVILVSADKHEYLLLQGQERVLKQAREG